MPVPFDIFAVLSAVNNNGQSVQEVKMLRFSRLLRVVKLGKYLSYFTIKLVETEPSLFALLSTEVKLTCSCKCGGGPGGLRVRINCHKSVARVVKAMRIVKRWEEELSISHSLCSLLKNITGANKQATYLSAHTQSNRVSNLCSDRSFFSPSLFRP